MVKTFERIMFEIRENTLFFILRSIGSVVTSSRYGDEALSGKMNPTHICSYPELAVKGLHEI